MLAHVHSRHLHKASKSKHVIVCWFGWLLSCLFVCLLVRLHDSCLVLPSTLNPKPSQAEAMMLDFNTKLYYGTQNRLVLTALYLDCANPINPVGPKP